MTARSKYLHHITLTTGHRRRSYLSEVNEQAITVAGDLLRRSLDSSLRVAMPETVQPRCSISATPHGACLMITVWGPDGEPLVTFGVAPRSRCGASLWRALHDMPDGMTTLKTSPDDPPGDPWCGVVIHPMLALYGHTAAQWLGDFERCAAWAWLGERGRSNVQ